MLFLPYFQGIDGFCKRFIPKPALNAASATLSVSRAHAKASAIKMVEEPTAVAIDIRADYVAKNGAPSAAADGGD